MSRNNNSQKQRLAGSKFSQTVRREKQAKMGRYEIEFPNYKKLTSTVNLAEDKTQRQIIGFLLLAMMLGAEIAEQGNVMGVNRGLGRARQPKHSDSGTDQVEKFDYKTSEEHLLTRAEAYKIPREIIEATNNFLEQNPEIDLAKLALDTADFEARSGGLSSTNDIKKFVADIIGAPLVSGLTAVAAAGKILTPSNRRIRSVDISSLTTLAIAAATSFLPTTNAEQIEKINSDLERIKENAEKIGAFQTLNCIFAYVMGWVPTQHEVSRNYKENQHFMNFAQCFIGMGSIPHNADLVRESVANESYLQTLAFLEVISELYHFDSISKIDKQTIARTIFSDKTENFDHNFFHLLGVPLVQEAEAAINYQLLLEGTRDFLLKSRLPIRRALEQDKDGNNPLHTLAAVAPLNQFKAFLDIIFGDSIPQDILEQKNNYGHSPLDILRSDDVQKEAINYVSKAMKNNFIIHTSAISRSDVLHKPGSLEVMHEKDVVLLTINGRRTVFPSYPKDAYREKPDGNYEVMDLLNNEPLETIPAEQYNKIKEIIPGGTSYALLAFESRQQKLQLITEKKLEKPKSQVENSAASTLIKERGQIRSEL